MTNRYQRAGVVVLLVIAGMVPLRLSAQAPTSKSSPKVKVVAATPIVSVEGKDNFDAYCAVCHGSDAKGHGPAAPAMKAAVPDLTTIALRNQGKFDPFRVELIVKGTGKTATPAHGVETMPIWGDVFRTEDPTRVTLRVKNLVKYVESIQVATSSMQ